jgi:hypothetical protein
MEHPPFSAGEQIAGVVTLARERLCWQGGSAVGASRVGVSSGHTKMSMLSMNVSLRFEVNK